MTDQSDGVPVTGTDPPGRRAPPRRPTLSRGTNLRGGGLGGGPRGGAELTGRRQGGGVSPTRARNAILVMVAFLTLLWLLQLVNWADGYHLDPAFGILPRVDGHLPDIVTAPFLHFSWQHLEGNSVPLLVLGFFAAYRGIARFLCVTAVALVTSGLAVWLFQPRGELTVGASGLIFGYFGYVLVRALLERNVVDAAVGVLAVIGYASILVVAVPGTPGVSWIDHVGGLVGGVLAGWLLHNRRRRPPARRDRGEGRT